MASPNMDARPEFGNVIPFPVAPHQMLAPQELSADALLVLSEIEELVHHIKSQARHMASVVEAIDARLAALAVREKMGA